jgi:hypothetical protein
MIPRILALIAPVLGLFMLAGCHVHHHDEPSHTHVGPAHDPVIVVPARGPTLKVDPDGEIDD